MPGIAGLITKLPRQQALAQLQRMVATMLHESFYVAGTWSDEGLGVYVGWVARQGTFDAAMPLRNECGDVALAFSGEEYPEPGAALRLRRQGHEVAPDGPDYLVHAYEQDVCFPAALNGRFHGLVADRSRRSALLFNDRYGMHRLYYHASPDAFYFAAEAKAILAARPELRSLDPQGLGEFLACGAVLENRTLFSGIQVLPPASAWLFRGGELQRRQTYFHPREWEEQERLDPESWYRQLRVVFTRNLPRYFQGGQPLAMSLTGGLDTRLILACHKPGPGALPCYTFGSMFRENQDVRVARRVATACGQSHQVITAGQEFLAQFARYAERAVYLSDGCVDVGRAPDLYLNERARQIAPVRMTGNYGGEILRAVRTFKPEAPLPGLFVPEVQRLTGQAEATFTASRPRHPLSFAAFRQAPWQLYGVLALEQTQVAMRSPFLDNDLVRTAYQAPEGALANSQASLRLIAEGDPALLAIPTDRGLGGNRGPISRALARGLLEFLFKAEYACDLGMPQWLARLNHGLPRRALERAFLGRHKPFHFRAWYRDALAGYLQEMLLDRRSLARPYLQARGLEAGVRAHLQGKRNFTNEIHKLLTLELLQRCFIDRNPAKPIADELYATASCL